MPARPRSVTCCCPPGCTRTHTAATPACWHAPPRCTPPTYGRARPNWWHGGRNTAPGSRTATTTRSCGLAGEGRGLLLAADHGDERCAQALGDVLDFLVGISHPVRPADGDGTQVPGWWCAPDRYLLPRDRQEFPGGDCNVGVAHGICGPLALLSLAHRSGHRVPGMQDAIRRMADWVLSVGYTDGRGMQWPGRVALPERSGEPSRAHLRPRPCPEAGAVVGAGTGAGAETGTEAGTGTATGARSRPGWCYGTSGIAWTLHLAGQALDDHRMTALAEEAVSALAHRPHGALVSDDPGLCHGRAGDPAHHRPHGDRHRTHDVVGDR